MSSLRIPRWRRPLALRASLLAALASSVCLLSYQVAAEHTPGSGDSSESSAGIATPEHSTSRVTSFTTAAEGSCLTWDIAEDGTVSNFGQADCASPHRFEVSHREDLSAYPSSEFGEDADPPSVARQAQLRDELCRTPTLLYLDGRFDPLGRYSIAPILPSAEAWKNGDRTMLCGLQSVDATGTPQLTTGNVADQDQARVVQPGECVLLDDSQSMVVVDCAEDHQLEAVSVVDLATFFATDQTPSVDDQNNQLYSVCTTAAMDYLGGEEALYQSTLEPFWNVIEEESWTGGSHSVNCWLVSAGEDSFNTVAGSALGTFTINGEAPPAQPERNPRRDE